MILLFLPPTTIIVGCIILVKLGAASLKNVKITCIYVIYSFVVEKKTNIKIIIYSVIFDTSSHSL